MNLDAYNIWFVYNSLRAEDLNEVREMMAEDTEAASEYIEESIITYERMKSDIEAIRDAVNREEFSRVYS